MEAKDNTARNIKDKPCVKCNKVKSIDMYKLVRNKPTATCISCLERRNASRSAFFKANPEKHKESLKRAKAYSEKNKEAIYEYKKMYAHENSEKLKAYAINYYQENSEEIKSRASKWRNDNIERKRESNRAWVLNNPEKEKLCQAKKRASRKECHVRNLSDRVSARISLGIRKSGYSKKSKTAEILGCDWDFFVCHIEKQFTKGMSWENRGEWHIDHIVPLASAETEDDVIALNHFTNLRPLWAVDNITKGDKAIYLI